jgi:hypothetical protein
MWSRAIPKRGVFETIVENPPFLFCFETNLSGNPSPIGANFLDILLSGWRETLALITLLQNLWMGRG